MNESKVKIIRRKILTIVTLLSLLFALDNQLKAEEKGVDYYNLAVKKYINDDLNGALLELDKYSEANPQDAKANLLRSLIMKKKGIPEGVPQKVTTAGTVEKDADKAEGYFKEAFKKYIEGALAESYAYLQKALKLNPDLEKAKRFLKLIEKRRAGIVEEDSAFVEKLMKEMKEEGTSLLPEDRPAERISVDFKDEDLSNILRVLSQIYNINIIADFGKGVGETEKARITVSLTDVSLEEALDAILGAGGYSYIKTGNIIRVVDKSSYVTTKVFKLSSISLIKERLSTEEGTGEEAIKNLFSQIEALLSDNGKLLYDETSRTLMVTDTLARLETISSLMAEIDTFTPQILIEAKIIELSPSYNDYVGIDWSVLDSYTVTWAVPTGTYSWSEDRKSKPEVEVSDVYKPTKDYEDVSSETGDTYEHTDKVEQTIHAYEKTLTQSVEYALKKTLTSTLSADSFQLVLSALISDTDAKVISSPNILTKNGREGYIAVGDEYPIPSYTYNEDTGGFEVSGFEYKEVGIILSVIPYIIDDDYISVLVIPEVSKKSGYTTFGGAGGASIPIISTTKVKTQGFIKSGHTLAIGGLIKESTTITDKKVPVLGDIPFLKRLFTHKATEIITKNVIIFITPTIITKENMDTVTALQSKKLGPKLGPKYEIKQPEAEKPRKVWGRRYERKK